CGLDSFEAFLQQREPGRLVLLTTRAPVGHSGFRSAPDETRLLGRERAGVPASAHARADARIGIPIRQGPQASHVPVAPPIALAEAVRQTGRFPPLGLVD